MKRKLNLYAKISKVDEEQRMVWGYATTEALDSQGEIISRAAVEKALDGYMKFGNIREMHSMSAVGVTKEAEMDDKGLFIGAHVVDDQAWKKVVSGVYKGFSIGGLAGRKKGNTINELELNEISLVDRPSNPDALFDCFKLFDRKASMSKAKRIAKSEDAMAAVQALAKLLGISDEALAGLSAEQLAQLVLDAFENREKPSEDDAVAQAMEAAVESLGDSVESMVSDGELEGTADDSKPADGEADDAAPAADESTSETPVDTEETKADDSAAPEGDKKEEDKPADGEDKPADGEAKPADDSAAPEDDKEAVKKSACSVADCAMLAEGVMDFANNLDFVAGWGESPEALAGEVKGLAVTLYEKMAELAAFEVERIKAQQDEAGADTDVQTQDDSAAPAGDSSEGDLINAVAEKAATVALAKSAEVIAALTARLESLEKTGIAKRFEPRQFSEESRKGMKLIAKGGNEIEVTTVAEAKAAGAKMQDVFKGVFSGQIR